MDVATVKMDRKSARELFQDYRKHQHWSSPANPEIDNEIRRIYQLIAQGRVVIRAMESISNAGLNAEGLPKLAICRADLKMVHWYPDNNGGGCFEGPDGAKWRKNSKTGNALYVPVGSFPVYPKEWRYEALLPPIPEPIKPKRGLSNYHVLWEAEWKRIIPADPLLLRHLGKSDMWLVCGAWELTEVERAVFQSRLNG